MRERKTVFMGDSITAGYGVDRGECWVDAMRGVVCNRGISGDTTDGMLRRFAAHVLREKPDRVVIMGGINDFDMGGTVHTVTENLRAMYELAQADGITVVPAICVNPDYDEFLNNDWAFWVRGLPQLPQNLAALADWIRMYANRHQLAYIDFAREFPKYTQDYCRYFLDGVHPNARGHAIMAEIAAAVLDAD